MEPGAVFGGRYEFVRGLGAGGAGELFLVRDRKRGKEPCALKILRPRTRDPALGSLFRSEFLLLTEIDHPCIVAVRDFGVLEGGEPYFTMDFVPGENGRSFVREDRLESGDYLDLAAGLLGALEHIHARGVLHRDIKPENIIMRRGDGGLDPVLVDFGLAVIAGAQRAGEASGTLPYIAPEVVAGGAPDARADLFSLGMVLFEMATGRSVGDRVELLRAPGRTLAPDRIRRLMKRSVRGGVPRRYEDLVSRLLSPTPAARHPSASHALRDLSELYGTDFGGAAVEVAAAPRFGAAPLVGRDSALEGLVQRVDALGEGRLLEPLVVVAGPEGIGVTRLLATMRNHAAVSGCLVASGASLRELATDLLSHPELHSAAADAGQTPEDHVFRADTALHGLSGDMYPVLLLDDVHAMDEREATALREWITALERREGRARLLLVLGGRSDAETPGGELLKTAGRAVPLELRDLAPLKRNDIRAALSALLAQPRIPAEVVQALLRATGGIPRALDELLQLLVQERVLDLSGDKPHLDAEKLAKVRLPKGVAEATRRRIASLDKSARDLVKRLALITTPLPAEAARALGKKGYDALRKERIVLLDRGRVRFASELTRRAADTLKGKARDKALAETAEALAKAGAPHAAALLYVEAGDMDHAREHGLPAARALREQRHHDEAIELLEQLVGDDQNLEAGTLLHDLLRAAGRWREAADLGLRLLKSNEDVELVFKTAAALRLSERLQESLDLLRTIDRDGRGETAMRIANARAAILGSMGRSEEALLESSRAEAAAGSALGMGGRVARVRANVLRTMGRTAAALRLEDAIIVASAALVPDGVREPALINRAHLHRRRARYALALRDVRAGLSLSRRTGSLYGAGTAVRLFAQIATALGRPHSAALRLESHRSGRERLGSTAGLARWLTEEADALARAGRPAEAEHRLNRVRQIPGIERVEDLNRDIAMVRALIAHLSGDTDAALNACDIQLESSFGTEYPRVLVLCQRATYIGAVGDLDRAESAWREAVRAMWQGRDSRSVAEIRLGLAAVAAGRGAWNLAERFLTSKGGDALALKTAQRAKALVIRAGAALHRGESGAAGRLLEEAVAIANHCTDVPTRAEVYMGTASLLEEGEMQRHLRQPTATASAALLEAARDIWVTYGNEAMLRKIDLHLAELPRSAADPLGGPEADRLVKVLHFTREMNREFDRDRLLGLILDRAIELTSAERGFVILLDEGKEIVHLARNLDRESVSEPERKISSQIMKEVVRTGRIVRSEDAETDNRFEEYLSVRQLRLKSIIAVPFRSGGRTIGALYLDNRFKVGNFGEQDERLLELFADQAVAAIDKSELVRELEGKRSEVEDLLKQLKSEMKKQGSELRHARKEIKQHRRARGWSFDNIIGRSVAMQALLREAKRVSPTELYALVAGENGTGKELLARAIHYASGRQSMPFVAVNCAAFPEGLLEAELFGHVRGSFTGADRDRMGLFEEADGGTLFLDEVGDMALSMQVKLLRALELGEVRRVGESKERTVDVRVVSATNADLEQLIRAGRFREDLYYRLAGMTLRIPPLRERLEDVEPLAYAFVEEAARREGRPGVSISNEAIARLESFSWSGNVRELRNVILRAVVTADGDVVRPEDIKLDSRGPTVLPGFDPGQADLILDELASRGFDLNARQRTAINRVLTRGKLAFGEYRELFRVSKSTTARDLERLVSTGLLERRGKTRAVVYLPGAKLQEVAKKVGEI